MFAMYKRDTNGQVKTGKDNQPVVLRNRVALDWTGKDKITEDSHKKEVDINNIIRKHGMDLIRKTAMLAGPDMRFDDVTGNDFQEAALIIAKAEQSFSQMPSGLRKKFNNSPAEFLDFVQNKDNSEKLYEMGLAVKPEPDKTIKVEVTNESLATKPLEVHKEINTPKGEGKD